MDEWRKRGCIREREGVEEAARGKRGERECKRRREMGLGGRRSFQGEGKGKRGKWAGSERA